MTGPGFEQKAPEGYEFTGEFRVPKKGEPFSIPGECWLYTSGADSLRRLILRKRENVVQVLVQGHTAHYAYHDPTEGGLFIGDVVEVPFGSFDHPRIGLIVGTGRERHTGPVKDVAARFDRIAL